MEDVMQAVRFDAYGGVDVLDVRTVERPSVGPGEVLVEVRAAGINPGETMIREGRLHYLFPASFPSGQGSDFAGIVSAIGPGVTFAPGDEVIGYTDLRASHAQYVVAPASQVVAKPAAVSWEAGGSLFVSGSTAVAATRAVALREGDVVVVAGATGGVGAIAVQLARLQGAEVVGVAGRASFEWLAARGATPVAYGPGLEERLKQLMPGRGFDAFLDLHGGGYVDLAVEALAVHPERVNTIIDFEAAARTGASTKASAEASSADTLAHLAGLIAEGSLTVPIEATFPLSDVRAAFTALERRHARGKIVLIP